MEFNNIIALVPEGEHFDSSAIINEGVFLTLGHVNNIETALGAAAESIAAAQANVDASQLLVSEANEALNAANITIGEHEATIADLQQQIVALKAAPAAPITATVKEKDEAEGKVVVESDITKEANRLRAMRDGKKK